jgi:site-specific recombinase XerC
MVVAAYIEDLGRIRSKPTVKQHLAAIRMCFDWLVTGGILPSNPASSVRGLKHVVNRGTTPVLTPLEARELLDSIDTSTLVGLRDRALIATMVYSFARVGAVVGMHVEDGYAEAKRWWIRLHEKGGKRRGVPAHHNLESYLDAYLHAASIAGEKKAPLFRTFDRRRGLTDHAMTRSDVLRMIERRAPSARGRDVRPRLLSHFRSYWNHRLPRKRRHA